MPTIPTRLIAAAAIALLLFGSGWYLRGVFADRAMLEFQQELAAKQADQQELKAKVEAADRTNTQASTARVDAQEQTREVEVQYVDREVTKFRIEYRDSACSLPAEWVRLYNRSLGLPDGVPEASGPRP